MRRLLLAMMTLAAVISMAAPVSAQTVGVVLMHGNTDTPSGTIASLAAALEGAGYPVERPEMCWSYRRRRDRPLLDCLSELEAPIERLSGRGVRAIVVAGMSVGGLGAVAFGTGKATLAAGDVDALLDFARKAPAARTAHPRTEHFAPLFVTLGAGEDDLAAQRPVIEGFWGGLAKRSVQIG